MKTIKKFIEDGFKGGFEYQGLKAEHGIKVKQASMDDNWHIYATNIKVEPMYTVDTERLLMMPKLWMAVGKHRKWFATLKPETQVEAYGSFFTGFAKCIYKGHSFEKAIQVFDDLTFSMETGFVDMEGIEVEVLDDGSKKLVGDLREILDEAMAGEFGDFTNTKYPAPKMALVEKFETLKQNVINGNYD